MFFGVADFADHFDLVIHIFTEFEISSEDGEQDVEDDAEEGV